MSVHKKRARKRLPRFASEDRERKFWAEHDSTDYVDWDKAVRVTLPKLKPSTATISLRLPASMLEDLKVLADRKSTRLNSSHSRASRMPSSA